MHHTNLQQFVDPYYGIPPQYLSNIKDHYVNSNNSRENFAHRQKTCTLCLFGVINRGIIAWTTIKRRIYNVLVEAGYTVKVFVYNLDVGTQPVDGVVLSQDLSNFPFVEYQHQSEKQADVDVKIDTLCRKERCRFRADYKPVTVRNALRQLYSEKRVGDFLAEDNSDIAIVCGPDFYIANDINTKHVRDAMTCNCVYTSQVNDAQGYTNGFYIGKPKNVARIMNRFNEYKGSNKDYEYYVKRAFEMHRIKHKSTDIVFFKIRASGKVHWQGNTKGQYLPRAERILVEAEYTKIGGV